MRIVAQFLIRLTGGTAPLDALLCAIQDEGWQRVDETSEHGARSFRFSSDNTPLMLAAISYDRQSNVFQLMFIQHWFRCILAGGWGKLGQLPDDISARIMHQLKAQGWCVAIGVDD